MTATRMSNIDVAPEVGRRSGMGVASALAATFLFLMILIALVAPWLAPFDYTTQNLVKRLRPPVFMGGEWAYPLGTDNLGRDILSRLIYGIRTSIAIAMAGTMIGAVIGITLGYLAARRRGIVDESIMMLVDVQAALPAFFVAIACIAFVGNSMLVFILLVSLEGWERYTRLVRGLIISEHGKGYVQAMSALGASRWRLDILHVLPNIGAALVVQATINFPWTILLETTLSFLGLGVQPPGTSLGQMLGSGRQYLLQAPWIAVSGVLDTLREQSNVGTRVFDSIFESLIDTDKQGDLSLRPGLADNWKRIDGRTIEFKLRRGVKFHNGEEMTAEDVAFSFGPERMWGFAKEGEKPLTGQVLFTQSSINSTVAPPEVHAVARRLLPQFEKIEIVDTHTVRFVNRQDDITLEGRLTRIGQDIVSKKAFLAAKDWSAFARSPVATGPYKVKEFKPDNVLVLEAHDAYWGGRPPIRELRFIVVPEVSTRINGLLSGTYDFITDVPPDQIKTVAANPKFEVVGGPILNHRLLTFNKNHPVLKDARIRRAMTHAIDRKTITEALWDGRTSVPAGLQWEYYGPMFQKDWMVPEFNPDLAKKLLVEAGYKGETIPFRVLNNYYTNQVANSQVLVEMWRSIGLNVD